MWERLKQEGKWMNELHRLDHFDNKAWERWCEGALRGLLAVSHIARNFTDDYRHMLA